MPDRYAGAPCRRWRAAHRAWRKMGEGNGKRSAGGNKLSMTVCRLCDQKKKLIKAHIVPRSFLQLSADVDKAAKILSTKQGYFPKRTLTGVYDQGILCKDCDAQIGVFDEHAASSLIHSKNVQSFKEKDVKLKFYNDAKPKMIQKFILSLAWRSSVTSHEFFSRVRLGPYEEKIREYLLSDDIDIFKISASIAEFDDRNFDTSFLNPHCSKFDGVTVWHFYANRFIFYVKADKQKLPRCFEPIRLQPGKVVMSLVREWHESKEKAAMVQTAKANPNAFRR